MTYRPDVDGLRALAVIAVVLFHVDVSWASGGYVGVDVFFVLSGYLITGVIRHGLAEDRFTLGRFYTRRVRRLLPAALVTVALTGAAGTYLMPDTALNELGGSVVFASVSFANVFFWLQSGYFDSDAMFKPLLHTWSLGVEEQFYMLWPGLLLLLHKRFPRPRAVPIALAMIGGASLWGAIVTASGANADAAFFLPHLRVWEFALGGLVWWLPHKPGRYVGELALLVGIAAILVPAHLYTESTIFPGATAVAPCLGTALVIWANNPRYGGWLLRHPATVFIGKISYSLYLVHWPLIVLYRNYTFRELVLWERCMLFAASFGLAVLLWKVVEERFRRPERVARPWPGASFALACAGASLALTVAGASLWANGLERDLTPANRATVDKLKEATAQADELTMRNICYMARKGEIDVERCLTPSKRLPSLLVVGDSFAAAMFTGMRRHFEGRASVHLAAATSCRPVEQPSARTQACKARNELIFNQLDLSQFDAVFVLGGFFRQRYIRQLPQALQRLEDRGARKLIVIGPAMSYDVSVPEIIARFGRGSRGYALSKAAEHTQTRFFEVDGMLREMSERGGATYVSLLSMLCPDGTPKSCQHTAGPDGEPLIRDEAHLSADGAAWVLAELEARGAPWSEIVPVPVGLIRR